MTDDETLSQKWAREKARADSLETRLAHIESRLALFLETGNRGVVWYAADDYFERIGPFPTQAQAWAKLRWGNPNTLSVHTPGAYVWCEETP